SARDPLLRPRRTLQVRVAGAARCRSAHAERCFPSPYCIDVARHNVAGNKLCPGEMGVLVMRTIVAVLGLILLPAISAWAVSTPSAVADDRMDQCLDITYDNTDSRDHEP